LPNDTRRFVHIKLADLFSGKGMHSQAAQNLSAAAECAVTYKDKAQLFMSETLMWIKHGDYYKADDSFKKALACSNSKEKEVLMKQLKEYYFEAAEKFEKANKNNSAIKIYEKLGVLPFITQEEKEKINSRLIRLYNRVGKIREAMALEQAAKR